MAVCVAMRLAAVQRCPVVPKPPQMAPSTARSRLASSITMMMFLPPISRLQCLNSGAQASAISRPTAVEPVKLITGTSTCCAKGAPAFGPLPLTRFTTPSGIPASVRSCARLYEDSVRALGRRDEAPLLVREVRGIYRQIHVLAVGGDKHSDQLVCVGRIAVLVGAAAARIHPLPIDEILVNTWCRCRGHTASWNAVLEL